MPSVSDLTVHGFKSIAALDRFELGALNLLIGSNGAGKSNLLELFRMLAAMASQRLQMFVAHSDGPDALLFRGRKHSPELRVECAFNEQAYSATLTAVGTNLVFVEETTHLGAATSRLGSGHYESNLDDPEKTEADAVAHHLRDAMSEWRVHHFHDTAVGSAIRQAQPARDNLRLHADGTNLAPFLRRMRECHPQSYRRVLESMRLAAPYFDDFVYREEAADRIELEWFERELDLARPHGPRQLSDGTLRFICLAALLNQPAELQSNPILIDEPELGLHPYALVLLAEMLKQASRSRQILVSTQSADLVSEFTPSDVITVRRRDGRSVFERPDSAGLREWLDEYTLGDLWRMNVVGSSPAP